MTYHCAPLMRRSLILVGCEGAKAGVQVSRRELHTYIHLNYVRVEFLSCKKKSLDLKLHFNLENYLFFMENVLLFLSSPFALKIMLIFICLFIFEKKHLFDTGTSH